MIFYYWMFFQISRQNSVRSSRSYHSRQDIRACFAGTVRPSRDVTTLDGSGVRGLRRAVSVRQREGGKESSRAKGWRWNQAGQRSWNQTFREGSEERERMHFVLSVFCQKKLAINDVTYIWIFFHPVPEMNLSFVYSSPILRKLDVVIRWLATNSALLSQNVHFWKLIY